MSHFNFDTKTFSVQSLQLEAEDEPRIHIKDDSVTITAQRGNERITITAAIPGVVNRVIETKVVTPGKTEVLTTPANKRRRHPLKGSVLPSTDPRTGENNALSKLTAKQVLEIRELGRDVDLINAYGTQTNLCVQLGKVYNVHYTTIYNILNRTSWKHI
jgi:hypothetical protein